MSEGRSLTLGCGGTIRLVVDADWLAMSDADLAFVRGLARSIDDYPTSPAAVPLPPASSPPSSGPEPKFRPPWLQPAECRSCGKVCASNAGLAAHRRHAHPGDAEREAVIDLVERVEPTEAELAEAMAGPRDTGGKHRFHGEHRSTREDTAHGGKRVYCECGWVTLPFDDRNEAREAFAAHLDEMSAARQGVA